MEFLNTTAVLADNLVRYTPHSLFLTGKAGTGKTTFLHNLRKNLHKKHAVVAPTGVAALNAGGSTIHSLFALPHTMFMPKVSWREGGAVADPAGHEYMRGVKLSAEKKAIIKSLELLIIDEVSMVRADTLDAIDTVLRATRRNHRNQPFGGVQLLLIGDLHQLPPVVREEEWELLSKHYESPFFFDSLAMKQTELMHVELQHIYRQDDTRFISLLNAIRHNEVEAEDFEFLQNYYKPDYKPGGEKGVITLTTHNRLADTMNTEALQSLPGTPSIFEGEVEGDFNDKYLPAEQAMLLKKDAQVMFLKNDPEKRFYNGKIGTVSRIDHENSVWVKFPQEPAEIKVEQETWRSVRYKYVEAEDRIEEEETGSYKQLPLRLAWAVTIHKSQGMTFEKAVIDAGKAFAPGQVYVALSRLRSLGGLILKSRIYPQAIRTDERIARFTEKRMNEAQLERSLESGLREYAGKKLQECFDWRGWQESLRIQDDNYISFKVADKDAAHQWYRTEVLTTAGEIAPHAARFLHQLSEAVQSGSKAALEAVCERVNGAQTYFNPRLQNLCTAIRRHGEDYELKKNSKAYMKTIDFLLNHTRSLLSRVEKAGLWVEALLGNADILATVKEAAALPPRIEKTIAKVPKKNSAGSEKKVGPKIPSYQETVDLYLGGKSLEDIATIRSLAPSTIETHISQGIRGGVVKLEKVLPAEKIVLIQQALREGEGTPLGAIIEMLGGDVSYGDIRMVQADNAQKMLGGVMK